MKPKFHYFFHNSPPPAPKLNQIIPIYDLPSYFFSTHVNIRYLYLGLPSHFFPLRFPTKGLAFHVSSIHATCPFISFFCISSRNIVWCGAKITLQFSLTILSLPLRANIFLSTIFLNILRLYFSLNVKNQRSQL